MFEILHFELDKGQTLFTLTNNSLQIRGICREYAKDRWDDLVEKTMEVVSKVHENKNFIIEFKVLDYEDSIIKYLFVPLFLFAEEQNSWNPGKISVYWFYPLQNDTGDIQNGGLEFAELFPIPIELFPY